MIKKRALKKFTLYSFAAFLIALSLSISYLHPPKVFESFDNYLRDYLFLLRGEINESNNVVIVDIDEKSLQKLGQWPWSRDKVANLLEAIANAGAAVIGFDIVFAEEDNSSPYKIFKKFDISTNNIPNYDSQLSTIVTNTPTILGYQFQLEDEKYNRKEVPSIPAVFIERNKELGKDHLINAKGAILNIPILQDNAYSSGFFNSIPDETGVIRSVPLIIRYDNQIFPSLALEIIRVTTGINKVYVNYSELGVSNISIGEFFIPTDRHGRLIINFRGGEKTFKYISAIDILKGKIDRSQIEGKAVLIGTSAAGLHDIRAIPFDAVYPGVEVHANAIDNIITGDILTMPTWIEGANLFHIVILSFLIIYLTTYTPFWFNPAVLAGFVVFEILFLYHMLFHYSYILNIFYPIITIILASIVATFMDYLFGIKQEEAIKKKFASKVSKEVMDSLLLNLDNNKFEAKEKEITIFFSDIRSFTSISESMQSAKELIEYLNKYMDPMTEIITKEKGTVDKYMGDAIMAYWNAPGNVEDHQDRALSAAIKQIEYLKQLNEILEKENKPHIDIGIGLNTGIATVGEMGSQRRSDYTVIGDPINLGSRLESLCKEYGAKIIISQYLKNGLKDKYILRVLDLVTVKGQTKPVEIYEVHGFGKAEGRLKEELDLFNNAVQLYRNSYFKEALEIFKEINSWEEKKNLKICTVYIDRCERYIKTPPKDFNGVLKLV